MSQNESPDASRRPKKLIFAPGDIAPTPELQATDPSISSQAQATAPSRLHAAEALRSDTSTPNSTTENQILSHPARAHQFFHSWFRDPRLPPSAAPETCTLATAELPSGRVSARILYLKELDERGWVVYSNWGSREGKGGQVFGREGAGSEGPASIPTLEAPGPGNKWGALTFSWASVERQVRVEGMLEPLSPAESELYWRTRERGSQIGAWASWQSKVLWSAEPEQLAERQRRKSAAQLQDANGAEVPADIDETDDEDGRGLLESQVREMEARFAGVEQIPLPPFWGGVRLVPESVEFWQGRRSRLHDRFRTTDNNTSAFAQSLAHLFGLDSSPFLELLVRGACLGLNVVCNIIMWALFTRALTAGPSTTKVSITNTAANFLATALFGMIIFKEAVGGLWWVGAAMMGAGCILVGMREGA
ncbi:FMN-binding split barrel-related protein [Penicillium chermesinum]|uniref:pyridoxal 5'-phosphate synthase n=1 Tax=Penicillium chermesinum TaxID=63820 RepID=A0A9W9TYW5_9EURO|nr:FMN-binding split barrel-related protein [Penicillium chermesinum]KAJ5246714.1 FMN-binding split barrel-related protein [Penicillium chermesinum]